MFVSVFRYDMFMGDRFPKNRSPRTGKVRLGIVYDVCSPLSGGYHLFLADLPAAILLNYFCKWQPEDPLKKETLTSSFFWLAFAQAIRVDNRVELSGFI